MPFVVSLSNHERIKLLPFDKLRANGKWSIFVAMAIRIIHPIAYGSDYFDNPMHLKSG